MMLPLWVLKLNLSLTLLSEVSSTVPSVDHPPLLVTTADDIFIFDEGTWNRHVLYTRNHSNNFFSGLGIHYAKKTLFWRESVWTTSGSYQYRHEIRSAKISNGSLSSVTIIASNTTRGAILSVDWINNKLYWIDIYWRAFRGEIIFANLDGSEKRNLLNVSNMEHGDHKLDPINRWIYFITKNDNSDDVFEKVDMDGRNRQIIDSTTCYTKGRNCIIVFAVDPTNSIVYWMDFYSSTLYSMNANVGNRQTHDFGSYLMTLTNKLIGGTFQTMDTWIKMVFKGNIYCIAAEIYDNREKIFRLNIQNSTISTSQLGVKAKYILLFHSSAQPQLV